MDLPEGITEIGTCAFARCRSLDRVTIPHSVKVIRREAFCNCFALERIVISRRCLRDQTACLFRMCGSKDSRTAPVSPEDPELHKYRTSSEGDLL